MESDLRRLHSFGPRRGLQGSGDTACGTPVSEHASVVRQKSLPASVSSSRRRRPNSFSSEQAPQGATLVSIKSMGTSKSSSFSSTFPRSTSHGHVYEGDIDAAPDGILNSIADRGSTEWMGMPDDLLLFGGKLHSGTDHGSVDTAREAASYSAGSSWMGRANEEPQGSGPDRVEGAEHEYEGLCQTPQEPEVPEQWLESVIQQTSAGVPSRSRDADSLGSSARKELSFLSRRNTNTNSSSSLAGRDAASLLVEGAGAGGSSTGNERAQIRTGTRTEVKTDKFMGTSALQGTRPDLAVQLAEALMFARGECAARPSAQPEGEEEEHEPFPPPDGLDWSSDSSMDLDVVYSLEQSRWGTLRMSGTPRMDQHEAQETAALGTSADEAHPLMPFSASARSHHQRSFTAGADPDGAEGGHSGWAPQPSTSAARLSIDRNESHTSAAYGTSEELGAAGTPVIECGPDQLAFSALALSPRPDSTAADSMALQGASRPADHNRHRLNAMLAAVATGGSRADVLAAAQTPPEEEAPSLTVQDTKPGAELRAEASLHLKVLRNNPAQSPEMLRKLIALAEQPTGAEAIAKEGGLNTVVMVMSSEWANHMIATMCAELLRLLLPGGIAMSRRKLLKRLPHLELGSLSGVGGVKPGGRPSIDAQSSAGQGVTLTKKHLRKLRKRSQAIAWACHALVRVMQRFHGDESVQDKGSSALWGVLSARNEPQNMADREIENYIQRVAATEVLEAGGVFVLVSNLHLHDGHENVAYSGVGALLAIAQLGPEGREAIDQQNGRQAIRAAMEKHRAMSYGGRFASLAAWLEAREDDAGGDVATRCSDGSSSSQLEDEDLPASGDHLIRARPKRMSLRRFSRRAPMVPAGAASLPDAPADIDLKHVRMDEKGPLRRKRGAEERLWDRFLGAIAGGRR